MATSQLRYNNQPLTRSSIYDMLLNYRGYGNPNGKYWFIGMEEHWGEGDKTSALLGCNQDSINYYSQKIVPFGFAKEKFYEETKMKGQSFAKGIFNLLQKLEGEQDYQNVLENNSFITNSRFAPFPTFNEIGQIFNKTKQGYLKDDANYKFEISQLWMKCGPKRTFCLSKTYTENFNLLFQNVIPVFNFDKIKIDNFFFREYKYGELSICQILHPRRFTHNYLEELKKKLIL